MKSEASTRQLTVVRAQLENVSVPLDTNTSTAELHKTKASARQLAAVQNQQKKVRAHPVTMASKAQFQKVRVELCKTQDLSNWPGQFEPSLRK